MRQNPITRLFIKSILFPLLISGCTQNKLADNKISFNYFVFSYESESQNYSVKFTNSDTIFIQQRYSEPIKNLYAVITASDIDKLNNLLCSYALTRYDTIYRESMQDGSGYKFYLAQSERAKSTYIYGDKGPKPLYNFGSWLIELKESRKVYPTSSKIDFGNLYNMLLSTAAAPLPKGSN